MSAREPDGPCVWLTPGPAITIGDYDRIVAALGWTPDDAFPPYDGEGHERCYAAPGGVRVAIYHPVGVSWGGDRALAVYGPAAAVERTADAIAARISVTGRRHEPVFRRHRAEYVAAAAAERGVWLAGRGDGGCLLWQEPDPKTRPRVIATGLGTVYALAAAPDEGAVYALAADVPGATRLARIDTASGATVWRHERLVRATQLAVSGGIVHVATATGLVRVDRAGAVEERAAGGVTPWLIGAALHGGVVWIDADRRSVVAYDGASVEVIGEGEDVIALDVDGDRAYALDRSGRVHACRRGRPPVTHAFEVAPQWGPPLAGLARIGPFLFTTAETEDSYRMMVQTDAIAIGYPGVEDAPAELRDATDPDALAVLADWLADRGVAATPELLARSLAQPLDRGWSDRVPGALAGPLGTPVVTRDRERGYHVGRGRLIEMIEADGWY